MTAISRKRLALTSSLAVLGLLASGCANEVTAYRTQRIGPSPMVITTDAYQRHLIVTPNGEGGWRTCAEASPDVFSVISGSGAADLGFNSTSTSGVEAQARAAMSIAQTAATADRTQTINLLRESMFRTCERYMSGAIDEATFVVQAGRDLRAMIAILAIEQLTQTERPPSTVISAGGTSATVIGGEDAQRQLDAAEEELTKARQAQTEANGMQCPATSTGNGAGPSPQAGGAGANGGAGADGAGANGSSGAGDANANGTNNAPQASDAGGNAEICDTKKTAVENANTRVQQAEAAVAAAQAKVNQAARSGGSTTTGTVNAGGGGGAISAEVLEIVAPTVMSIVERAFSEDETQLFCLQVMSRPVNPIGVDQPTGEGGASVRQMCVEYLAALVQSDMRALTNRPASPERQTQLEQRIGLIEAYLTRQPGPSAAERWNELAGRIRPIWPASDLTVLPSATIEDIRRKMRENVGPLRDILRAMNQGER